MGFAVKGSEVLLSLALMGHEIFLIGVFWDALLSEAPEILELENGGAHFTIFHTFTRQTC